MCWLLIHNLIVMRSSPNVNWISIRIRNLNSSLYDHLTQIQGCPVSLEFCKIEKILPKIGLNLTFEGQPNLEVVVDRNWTLAFFWFNLQHFRPHGLFYLIQFADTLPQVFDREFTWISCLYFQFPTQKTFNLRSCKYFVFLSGIQVPVGTTD